MFQTNIWCYPWDLVDEGIDAVLDRLKGEAGATGISVATCYHSIDQLRPHPGVSPRTFRSPGGVQFQPDTSTYANTRLKPVVAGWLKKSNPLATIAEACTKRGLKLRGWTVCCHGSATVKRYENCAVKDVFGDIDSTWLCAANPDVGEYLRAMVEDLTKNYPFETIELERPSFPPSRHAHAHYKVGIDLGQVGNDLRNLCFCESCRQVAGGEGIDVPAAANLTKTTLENVFASGKPPKESPEEFTANNPELKAYIDWRCKQITSLIESIRKSCSCRMIVHKVGKRFDAATDFAAIAARCDGLLTNCPALDREGLIEAVVRDTLDDAGEMNKVELGLNLSGQYCPDSAALVRAMGRAANLGVRSVNIYNYGMLSMNRLEWIKQGARHAQREAS